MRVAGIDLGKRKAALSTFDVNAEGKVFRFHTMSLLLHPALRSAELYDLATFVLNGLGGVNYVFIEEPLVGRGVKASMSIAETAGAVLAASHSLGTHAEYVNVKAWKKRLIGNGNASKHEVQVWLKEHHVSYAADCGDDQDKYDATCVGLFGLDVLRVQQHIHPTAEVPQPADTGPVPEW